MTPNRINTCGRSSPSAAYRARYASPTLSARITSGLPVIHSLFFMATTNASYVKKWTEDLVRQEERHG